MVAELPLGFDLAVLLSLMYHGTRRSPVFSVIRAAVAYLLDLIDLDVQTSGLDSSDGRPCKSCNEPKSHEPAARKNSTCKYKV